VRTVSQELIILGDINIDYKDGCTNSKWSNMILDQSLTQLIDKPTRVTSTTSSIIDHVNVSHPEHIIETNVPIIAISDHYPVCITRKINQRYYPNLTHKTIKYRCFKNFKEDLFLARFFCASLISSVNQSGCLEYFIL
jgi:hypothetical protein